MLMLVSLCSQESCVSCIGTSTGIIVRWAMHLPSAVCWCIEERIRLGQRLALVLWHYSLGSRKDICAIKSLHHVSSKILFQKHHHHNHFTALFLGPPGWAGARRELDFMVQGEINRDRHTDHPAGRHFIRTNQCPPQPSYHIFLQAGCPSCRPTNSVKALKAEAIELKPMLNCLSQVHLQNGR